MMFSKGDVVKRRLEKCEDLVWKNACKKQGWELSACFVVEYSGKTALALRGSEAVFSPSNFTLVSHKPFSLDDYL